MSDVAFSSFQSVTAIVLTFVYSIALTVTIMPFITDENDNKKGDYFKAGSVGLIYMSLSTIVMFVPPFGLFGMVLVIVLPGIISGWLGINRYFVIYLGIVFFCFSRASGLVGNSVIYILGMRWAENMLLEDAMRNAAFVYAGVYIVETIVVFVLIYIFCYKVIRQKLTLSIKEWAYLSIVPIIGVVFAEIVDRLLFVQKDNVVFGIYDEYPAFLLFVPMISVLFCVGIFLTVISYLEMVELQDENKKFFAQEQQIKAMQERMEDIQKFYGSIRKMRHEMKNHFTNLKGLARNGSYDEIDQYISKIDGELGLLEMAINTGEPVLDVVISDKKKLAEELGIKFEVSFMYPKNWGFDSYDIGIIVNNLLMNAIEACQKITDGERYIRIRSYTKKKFYMIDVSNSCVGKHRINVISGLPETSKDNANSHGIGLVNVRDIAHRYMGDIDIKVLDNEFDISVLLQEPI